MYYFYFIAYPVADTIQHRYRSIDRSSAVITKFAVGGIDTYHSY